MTITLSGLFLLICIGLGIWFKKDSSFRKREFLAVSLFWILLVATPWGAAGVSKVQQMIGNGAQMAGETVNSVSD
jgi:preprotein translocase subunit SecG